MAWPAKLGCTLGVAVYYVVGYFTLNRVAFARYHDVPRLPLLDELPLLPWSVVIYNSVFALAILAIWLLPHTRSVGRHACAALVGYSATYLVFWLLPTQIERPPLPDGTSPWLQALRVVRTVDRSATCFPSLHLVAATLAVLAHQGTPVGRVFLPWMLAIAISTLTTGQHVALDLPAGAAVAHFGYYVARRVLPAGAIRQP